MQASGVGKVPLAHAPADVRQRVLESALLKLLPRTVTDPGALRRQLDRVLTDGYATAAEEMTAGASSIAVPITTSDGVVGALGFVVADLRRSRARLLSALQVAARSIQRLL